MSLTKAFKEVSKEKIGGKYRTPDQIRNIYNKIDNIYEFLFH